MSGFWQSLSSDKKIALAVLVAALGYFVDVYDLVLFSVLRVASLSDLHVAPEDMLPVGARLLNMQLYGFLLGGLVWGIMGDKIGRTQVLFGSIILYSLANMVNAFVATVDHYALCRFVAGVGLAGEIGAGITLVSELMPRDLRGYGTTVVATVGVLGGVIAGFMGHTLPWQTAYIVGGVMGLALLVLRVSVCESGLFDACKKQEQIKRGNFLMLLSPKRLPRYLASILIGAPTWYGVGILITFAPEIGHALNLTGELKVATALPVFYVGLVIGDLSSGLVSQYLQSRKKAMAVYLAGGAATMFAVPALSGASPEAYYSFCFVLGIFLGYWVLMLTAAAEQFGTNLRATAATSVPNFVRATGVLCTTSFVALKPMGVLPGALIVGAGAFIAAGLALIILRETFSTDLDFIEQNA
jgi:MFS family permease